MLRWLLRLLILGLLAAAAAFVAQRLMNEDEDFDDFDDIDAGFEFEETPVEIDVPADSGFSAGASLSGDTAQMDGGGSNETFSMSAMSSPTEAASTLDMVDSMGGTGDTGMPSGGPTSVDELTEQIEQETEVADGGDKLTEIKGIGAAYEARLKAIGINTFSALAESEAASLAEQIEVTGGASTIEDWISQARDLQNEGAQASTGDGQA